MYYSTKGILALEENRRFWWNRAGAGPYVDVASGLQPRRSLPVPSWKADTCTPGSAPPSCGPTSKLTCCHGRGTPLHFILCTAPRVEMCRAHLAGNFSRRQRTYCQPYLTDLQAGPPISPRLGSTRDGAASSGRTRVQAETFIKTIAAPGRRAQAFVALENTA